MPDIASTSPRRLAAALLAVALLTAACGGDDEEAADDPQPTTAPTSPTTTEPAEDEPPPLNNTGEDFVEIVQSLKDYENWLYQNPDPELLDLIIDPSCACYEQSLERLRTLDTNSWKLEGRQAEYEDVDVVSEADPNTVQVSAAVTTLTLTVRDAAGERVDTRDTVPPPGEVLLTLTKQDGRWRIAGSELMEAGSGS